MKDVTCVKFVRDEVLISASSDGEIKLWTIGENSIAETQSLKHHSHSVTTIASTKDANVFVSGSADGHLTFWEVEHNEGKYFAKIVTDIDLGMMTLPLTSAISVLPSSNTGELVVAVGTTSKVVSIYTGSVSKGFKLSSKLEGHEDWIRALSFKILENGNLYLASGSQDRYIRIWTVQVDEDSSFSKPHNELEDDEDDETDQLSNIVYQLKTDVPYSIKFDALIIGHDDWVYSLRWHPSNIELMSSSADSSVMIWIPDNTSGVWLCKTRLGELSSKGASTATGSYGGVWYSTWVGDDCLNIVSLTNMGSLKLYSKDTENSSEQDLWISKNGITGNIKNVTDIAWSPEGNYILTTSLDKTTRLFAPYQNSWYEVSRPQIHGYEMICISPLDSGLFISGGDEKILRVFKATKVIANLLNNLVGHTIDVETLDSEVAAVPVLSLSNKAINSAPQVSNDIENDEDQEEEEVEDYTKHGLDVTVPPLEEQLQRHTLWPEVEKIYGHGYELVCTACTRDKKLLVSACRANSIDHAVIRCTNLTNWQEACNPLAYHKFTINRLQFSYDDKLLLSVSRDRTWAVWNRDSDLSLSLIATGKKHTRIIWDCAWFEPSLTTQDNYYFATCSRDMSYKVWKASKSSLTEWEDILTIKAPVPVTSIDIIKINNETGKYLVAGGLDNGDIIIYLIQISREGQAQLLEEKTVDMSLSPAARVNRVAWSPKQNSLQLAIASEDHSVRILSVSP